MADALTGNSPLPNHSYDSRASRTLVPAAELAVLEQLWQREYMTVKDLSQLLYRVSTPSCIATVQKLLTRLEDKGYAFRDREAWPHRFRATIHRNDLVFYRLQVIADDLCDGNFSSLLKHLLKPERLTVRQCRNLQELLDELDSE